MNILLRLSLAILCLTTTPLALAERLALLVGVSEYPNLPKSLSLEGPRNDVVLVRQVLEGKGFPARGITLLADGVPGAAEPTRAQIVAAIAKLQAGVKSGDYVVLYFAGHGSQQPADRDTPEGQRESDGLHEIFLARDVRRWEPRTGGSKVAIPNAIVDFELNQWVDSLVAKGAFVFAIFDACHSATLVRGANDAGLRWRSVDAVADLGIPAEAMKNAQPAATTRSGDGPAANVRSASDTKGQTAFFYASSSTQITPETNLPGPDGKRHGLFTYSLMQAFNSHEGISYSQLGQQVLSDYAARNLSVTPEFVGSALTTPVLGSTQGGQVTQWKIDKGERLTVRAGALHQMAPGSVVAVLPEPLAQDAQALGYLRIGKVDLLSSAAEPISFNGQGTLRPQQIPEGAYARLVTAAAQYTLHVALPKPQAKDPPAIGRALAQLQAQGVPNSDILWQKTAQGADLRLQIEDGRLWFLPPNEALRKTDPSPHLSIGVTGSDLEQEIASHLHRIARAVNLMRIAARTTATSAAGLEVTATASRQGVAARTLEAHQVSPLRQGDKVKLQVDNKGGKPLDVTVLYVDSRYGIDVLFPRGDESNRVQGASLLTIPSREAIRVTTDTTGLERLILIAVEPKAGDERQDFSFLAQERLERSRSAAVDDVMAAFEQAGFATHRSRGDPPRLPRRTTMIVYNWNVGR